MDADASCTVTWTMAPQSGSDYDLYVSYSSNTCPTTSSSCIPRKAAGIKETCAYQLPVGTYYAVVTKKSGRGSYTMQANTSNCAPSAPTSTTSCTVGWQCKDSGIYGYRNPDCSWENLGACGSNETCSGGVCTAKPATSNSQSTTPASSTPKPLLWYSFNGDYKDSSGNNYHGTANGGVAFANEGIDGKSASFNGSTGYVSNAALNWNFVGPATVTYWAKIGKNQVKNAAVFGVGSSDSPNRFLAAPWSDGALYWDYGTYTTGRVSADYRQNLDKWTYVALVSGGNNGTYKAIYINGVLAAEGKVSDGPKAPLTGISVGRGFASQWYYYSGLIDEFKTYGSALTADEIKQAYAEQKSRLVETTPPTTQCVSHSSFSCSGNDVYWFNSCSQKEDLMANCGQGTCQNGQCTQPPAASNTNPVVAYSFNGDYKDSSGNGFDGTPYGTATIVNEGIDGKSVSFYGDNGDVHNNSFQWKTGGATTAMFWLKMDKSDVQNGMAFGIGGSESPNRFLAAPWSDGILYWDYGTTVQGRTSVDYRPNQGKWTHVTLVSSGNNGAQKAIYINGELAAQATTSDGPDAPLQGISIGGAFTSLWQHYKGLLDEFRVYNTVLTPQQVKQSYQEQKARLVEPVQQPVQQPVPVASTAPVCIFDSVEYNPANKNQEVAFKLNGSDPQGKKIYSLEIDFGDGTGQGISNTSTLPWVVNHGYTGAQNTYNVKLTVANKDGQKSEACTRTLSFTGASQSCQTNWYCSDSSTETRKNTACSIAEQNACGNGCNSQTGRCNTQPPVSVDCTSHSSVSCYNNDVYWFDSCGNAQERKESCQLGCAGGACNQPTCQQPDYYACKNNDVYWYNFCNNQVGSKKETCSNGCSNGACNPAPKPVCGADPLSLQSLKKPVAGNANNGVEKKSTIPKAISGNTDAFTYKAWTESEGMQSYVYFSKSPDNGATWSASKKLSTSGGSTSPHVTAEGGQVTVEWDEKMGSGHYTQSATSADLGNTWETMPAGQQYSASDSGGGKVSLLSAGNSIFCSASCQCPIGRGICGSDSDCANGYCIWGDGKAFGYKADVSVCEATLKQPMWACTNNGRNSTFKDSHNKPFTDYWCQDMCNQSTGLCNNSKYQYDQCQNDSDCSTRFGGDPNLYCYTKALPKVCLRKETGCTPKRECVGQFTPFPASLRLDSSCNYTEEKCVNGCNQYTGACNTTSQPQCQESWRCNAFGNSEHISASCTLLSTDSCSNQSCNQSTGKCPQTLPPQPTCTSRAYPACYGGDAYWHDSCGNKQELRQSCAGNGCTNGACNQSRQNCQAGWKCTASDRREYTNQSCNITNVWICNNNETCSAGECVPRNNPPPPNQPPTQPPQQACRSHDYYGCFGNDVYWFNSCLNRENIKDACGSQGCSNSQCKQSAGGGQPPSNQCTPEDRVLCSNGDLYSYDSCGNRGGLYKACGSAGCSNNNCNSSQNPPTNNPPPNQNNGNPNCIGKQSLSGNNSCESQCTPHSSSACYNGDVYWFNSCGNAEDRKESCQLGCTGGACNRIPGGTSPVIAGGSYEIIESGQFRYKVHLDNAQFKILDSQLQCPKYNNKSFGPPHLNIQIFKSSTELTNWHIAWQNNNCLIAWDSKTKVCKDPLCYEKKEGRIRDVLYYLGIPNSAVKDLENSQKVKDFFRIINITSGESESVLWFAELGVLVAGASVIAVKAIARLIGCLLFRQCALPLSTTEPLQEKEAQIQNK